MHSPPGSTRLSPTPHFSTSTLSKWTEYHPPNRGYIQITERAKMAWLMQALPNGLSTPVSQESISQVWASLYWVSTAFYTSATIDTIDPMQSLRSRLADLLPRLSTPLRGNGKRGSGSEYSITLFTPRSCRYHRKRICGCSTHSASSMIWPANDTTQLLPLQSEWIRFSFSLWPEIRLAPTYWLPVTK